MIMEHIIRAGLDPHFGFLHRWCDFGFAMDLCAMMEPEADLEAARFLKLPGGDSIFLPGRKSPSLTKEGMKELVRRFESRKASVGRHVDSIADSLLDLFRDYREMV
jgi:hypothetical protein